jgi:hypothetical protein
MVSLPALGQLGLDAPLQLGLDELVATNHLLATELLIPFSSASSQQLAPVVLYATSLQQLLSTHW